MKSSTLMVGLFALSALFLGGCFDNNNKTIENTTNSSQVEKTGSIETESGVVLTGDITLSRITLADIATHNTKEDCRTSIDGNVYNVTAFFGTHPGGDQNLFRVCGIDATQAFRQQHGNAGKPNNVLAGFEIGTLIQ